MLAKRGIESYLIDLAVFKENGESICDEERNIIVGHSVLVVRMEDEKYGRWKHLRSIVVIIFLVIIPNSITKIGTQIFYKANNLSTVYYNSSYSSVDNPFNTPFSLSVVT